MFEYLKELELNARKAFRVMVGVLLVLSVLKVLLPPPGYFDRKAHKEQSPAWFMNE